MCLMSVTFKVCKCACCLYQLQMVCEECSVLRGLGHTVEAKCMTWSTDIGASTSRNASLKALSRRRTVRSCICWPTHRNTQQKRRCRTVLKTFKYLKVSSTPQFLTVLETFKYLKVSSTPFQGRKTSSKRYFFSVSQGPNKHVTITASFDT